MALPFFPNLVNAGNNPTITVFANTGPGGGGGVDLRWIDTYPDTGNPDDQFPVIMIWHPGGYHAGNFDNRTVREDCAHTGFLAICSEYRLAPPSKEMNTSAGLNNFEPGTHPSPGQDTINDKGYSPEANEDCNAAVLAARLHPKCNGTVIVMGGSAGGAFAAYQAGKYWNDTNGSRPDLAVACSGAAMDNSALDFLNGDCTSGQTCPHAAVSNWFNVTDYWVTNGGIWPPEVLAELFNGSPVAYVNAGMCPTFVLRASIDSYHIQETYDRFIAVALQNGLIESTKDTPEIGTFKDQVVTVGAHAHAFEYWNPNPSAGRPLGARDYVLPWILGYANITPPPPPPDDKYPYTAWLTTTTPGATGTVVPASPAQSATTCQLTNLTPSANYTFHLIRNSATGASTEAHVDFTADPPAIVRPPRKKSPVGLLALFAQGDGGAPQGNWQGQSFWHDSSVDGSRWRAGWSKLNPANGTFTFQDISDWLSLSNTLQKFAALSVYAGIPPTTPAWVLADPDIETVTVVEGGDVGIMPVPWNPRYQQLFGAFIQALGAAFDGDKALSYIVMSGAGRLVETLLGGAHNGADETAFDTSAVNNGYADAIEAWLDSTEHITTVFKQSFPNTPVVWSLDAPFAEGYGIGGKAAIQQLVDDMFGLYPPADKNKSIGLMQAGLNPNSTNAFIANALIENNAGLHPAGFQTVSTAAQGAVNDGYTDSLLWLTDSFAQANNLGAHFIEIYGVDANNQNASWVAARASQSHILKSGI